ncbi:SHOCT domain-containing protein [Clostridioides difficile]
MGLFGGKEPCCICGEKGKQKISDGVICSECLKKYKDTFSIVEPTDVIKKISSEEIKKSISLTLENRKKFESFNASKKVGIYLLVDENKKQLIISDKISNLNKNKRVYDFREIISFELLEDDETIVKSGLGGAIGGGLLFGETGAIAGSILGKKKIKTYVNSLKIKITINNIKNSTKYIYLINSKTSTNSSLYKESYNYAQEILSTLSIITSSESIEDKKESISSSTADEILKYKNLLNMEAITQEEFDAKKKELLNL